VGRVTTDTYQLDISVIIVVVGIDDDWLRIGAFDDFGTIFVFFLHVDDRRLHSDDFNFIPATGRSITTIIITAIVTVSDDVSRRIGAKSEFLLPRAQSHAPG